MIIQSLKRKLLEIIGNLLTTITPLKLVSDVSSQNLSSPTIAAGDDFKGDI